MEYATLQQFLEYGTPGIMFILILMNLYMIITVNNLKSAVIEMKSKIIWRDTHIEMEKRDNQRFQELDRRIERLEEKDNKV